MSFTQSPQKGDTYTFRGVEYTFNGSSWTFIGPEDGVSGSVQTYSGPFAEPPVDHYSGEYQGYYSELTNFYFSGGVATETEVDEDNVNEWIDVNFVTDSQGYFDYRPEAMKKAVPTQPLDPTTGVFTLEGLSLTGHVLFRASMTFEPEEDGGQLEARLLFNRHSGTTPSDDFAIEDVALTMNQGTDTEYPAEPFLSFFVGDTIDTNGAGDSGKCKFQIRSNVNGTVRMRALTWYISA